MSTAVEVLTTLLTIGGLIYMLLALLGARRFERDSRALLATGGTGFASGVSILKPLKGVDPRMYAGLVSHCDQHYTGGYELLFGVSSLDDPAAAEVQRLQAEFPACDIRLIECNERLGTSGKVSSLIQLLRHARYDHILINDSDIRGWLHHAVTPQQSQGVPTDLPEEGLDLEGLINGIEKDLLMRALERSKWVKKKAARLLRLNTRSFRYRLEKYAIKGGRD